MIAAIHQNFMNSHFKFLQKGDPISGNVPGYQARLLLPRYFLMHDDLTSCINGKWKENASYQNVIEYNQNNLSIETQQLQERKMEHTFNIMTTSLCKHFDAWANRHLPLALWSEQPIAQAVASFLLNRPPNGVVFESPIHERKFDVAKFHEFLNLRCTTKNSIVNTEMVTQYQQEIQQIQEGVDLWCNTPSLLAPLLQDYRLKYILRYASFPTNSHNAERGVKLSNHCSLAKRG